MHPASPTPVQAEAKRNDDGSLPGRAGEEAGMSGVITGREVVTHLGTVWREFGTACTIRCLWALAQGREVTFLELAFGKEHSRSLPRGCAD